MRGQFGLLVVSRQIDRALTNFWIVRRPPPVRGQIHVTVQVPTSRLVVV